MADPFGAGWFGGKWIGGSPESLYAANPPPPPASFITIPTPAGTVPGAGRGEIASKFMSNVAEALRGELPADVRQMISQRAAELGVASGVPGSEFARNRE